MAKNKTATPPKTSKYDNLWERLFDRYDLPRVEHPDIDRELEWFINHPSYIERVQSRAEPFLYSIVRQVEKQEIPGELALLPVIESAFQPHAVSPAQAAGIWQFIPSTGRLYGLKKSRSYDGRRDVYASTRAAIKYLKKLQGDFNGDWLLAIAGYNCGEGAVSRAIRKNEARGLPTDFWSLDLPRETRVYVPRLLAVARLFSDAVQYGIDLRQIPNKALFKTVKVKSQLDLALAADAADMSLDQMMELNPGFKRQVTDVDGSYRLFVPAHKYRSFKEALPSLVEAGTPDAGYRSNALFQDDLIQVAEQSLEGSTPRRSAEKQPHRSSESTKKNLKTKTSRNDAVGQSTSTAAEAKVAQRVHDRLPVASVEKSPDKALNKVSYTIQGGDTLYSIARSKGVDVDTLRKWNHLSAQAPIKSGQKLVLWSSDSANKLPLSSSSARTKAAQSIRYTVKPGDSLFAISRRFNVSVTDLRKWNGTKLDKHLVPGLNLTVSADN